MKISRELKTGLIALAAMAIFIWGFSYIKGEKLFDNSRYFYAIYDDVQGLEPSAEVTLSGFKVGKVDKIYFHPTQRGKVVVKFSVEDHSLEFSKNSSAQVYSPSLISGNAVKIVPNYNGDIAQRGDTLRGSFDGGMLGDLGDKIAPLETKISSFLVDADTLLNGFNQVLDQKGRANLQQSLANLNSTLASFKTASVSLNRMLAKNGQLDSVLTNANVASGNLVSLTDSLNQANLKATIAKLETTVNNFNSILGKIDKGEGSIGKLLKDEGLYNNLEGASKELEQLLRDFKENPKRYVHFSLFGKKNKRYKVVEVDSVSVK